MDIKDSFERRRSIYSLGSDQIMPKDDITGLIKHTVKYAPSAFNSQSARIIILYGQAYQKLWDTTLTAVSKVTPPEKMDNLIVKINSFKKGLGTILFFEDNAVVAKLQKDYPLYFENFPKWSLQSNGMLQYMIWLALSSHQIGASLQHYNPLIDEDVHTLFDVPDNWQLLAQMPFGSIAAPADAKIFLPIDERVKVFD